ncbi:MAG TPA: bacillithiol biosynthesis cysteine-adding enzyme BshC [Thermoanaerobaculia bacterium]|nr:bacillithiol biosynthesis cysteine-adding enzyme BshC [Thermoanaerobaculia bacterium]
MTASGSSSSGASSDNPSSADAGSAERSAAERGAPPLVIPAPLPPLPAAWLAGRDLDLLAPLSLARLDAPLQPAPRVDRTDLAAGLERANRSYGHPRAAELAARLADPATRTVVGGQQPGLFGGPLLVLLKMVAAARWADELERRGEPAVALFWVATEDHDWDEAAWAAAWTSDGVRRLELGPDPHPLVPLGMRTLGPAVDEARAALAALFPFEPYAAWVETLGRWYRPDARFGEAFCRVATALLGERCPLLVDAQLPELKAAERPLLRRLVERRAEVDEVLASAAESIVARGYPLQVAPQRGAAPLSALSGVERRRIVWNGEHGFTLRGTRGEAAEPRPVDELLALIDGNPAAISPNALARPAIQDAVLGTSVQVMGPSEMAYLAQAAPLYALLGVQAPAVAPRPRALLLEERQLATLRDGGLDPRLLLAPEGEVERALAAQHDDDPVGPAQARALAELETLRQEAVALDPNLERPWEKTHEQVKTAFERFAEKLTRARAQKDQVAQRRLASLREYCAPGGVLHERVLAAAHFRGRFGDGLAEAIWQQLSIATTDVQLLRAPEPAAAETAAAMTSTASAIQDAATHAAGATGAGAPADAAASTDAANAAAVAAAAGDEGGGRR